MPVQDFTDEEADWMIQFTGNLTADRNTIKTQVNLPIANIKAARVAAATAKIAAVQASLDNLDNAYAALKDAEFTRLSGLIDRLNTFKTKLQNTPD